MRIVYRYADQCGTSRSWRLTLSTGLPGAVIESYATKHWNATLFWHYGYTYLWFLVMYSMAGNISYVAARLQYHLYDEYLKCMMISWND
jgi:hypothetical protein